MQIQMTSLPFHREGQELEVESTHPCHRDTVRWDPCAPEHYADESWVSLT